MSNAIQSIEKTHDRMLKMPNDTGWQTRHLAQFSKHPLGIMIQQAAVYAELYERQYESKLSEDGVLGECWLDILKGIRGLLNGELHGLDGGTMDALILNLADSQGFDTNDI